MGEQTGIEWADSTFNPWIGCQKVSPGCDYCYAEARDNRFRGGHWGPGAPRRRTSADYWRQPIRWNRELEKRRKSSDLGLESDLSHRPWPRDLQHLVFCASFADVFDNAVPREWRADLWQLIRNTPALTWQILTKRPQNIVKMLPPDWKDGWPNVWLGTSVENQAEADRRIPHLLDVPSTVHFLSCEPLLETVDFDCIPFPPKYPLGIDNVSDGFDALRGVLNHRGELVANRIKWVICGGESGKDARPMHPDWARSIRDDCGAAGVPFFFKQWGEYLHEDTAYDRDLKVIKSGIAPNGFYRVGKKAARCQLDGREHKEFPNLS